MFISPCFFPKPTSFPVRALVLMFCLGLTVLLAESCVKRPNWEPTPGVSPKGIERGSIPY
jgi:hypothetical protein